MINMNEIYVLIPKEDSSYPFTCYAEGSFIRIEDAITEYQISFKEDDILIVFFHFPHHRRLYITVPKGKIDTLEDIDFWNISEERQILAELRGRCFDRLKLSIRILKEITKGACFSYPVSFWSQLIMLIQQNKHSKMNLQFLCEAYKEIKKIEKIAGEKQNYQCEVIYEYDT